MLLGDILQYFFGIAIFLSSIFLILLVLVQRGRGGGLTGALGGPGGQSAFGTKAGDLFTRITIGVAAFWILLCASSVILLKSRGIPELGAGTAAGSPSVSGIGGDTSDADIGSPSIDSSAAVAEEGLGGDLEDSDSDTDAAAESEAVDADEPQNADAESADSNADEETPSSTDGQ